MVCGILEIFFNYLGKKKKDKTIHYQEQRKEYLSVSLFIQDKLCPGKVSYKNENSKKVILYVQLSQRKHLSISHCLRYCQHSVCKHLLQLKMPAESIPTSVLSSYENPCECDLPCTCFWEGLFEFMCMQTHALEGRGIFATYCSSFVILHF